jgi:hypothetical protein
MPTSVARVGANLPNGNFLPEIWSKKINFKYYKETFLMDITNTNWQGEIKGLGSKVIIRVRPTISTFDYSVNGNITYQNLTDDKLELLIDKAKGFAFKVDDVDAAQSDIAIMNEASQDAAEQLKIVIDANVLQTVFADATNSLSTLTMDKTNVLDWIIDAGTKLNESNVPRDGRWLLIPPKACGFIQKSDLKDASLSGDSRSILRDHADKIGRIAGFDIYCSNNLSVSGTTFQCFAGQKNAVTFAAQITKVETVRLQDTFGDAIRGLNTYGFKTVVPSGLVSMPAIIA